jgi:predicted nucleic acid-binding protein
LAEIIVNTSPLQYLHQAGQLGLLPNLFGRVTVPGAVAQEIGAGRRLGVDLPTVEELAWVEVQDPVSPAGVLLAWALGAGESSSLSLALERPGAWVVLNDRLARQAAVSLGVPLLGTAGILLRGKRQGFVEAVGPILDRLTALGFRLHGNTRQIILRLAGED